jgi:hypothetical protein
MDFIERIFHISPDGGSGVLEAMLLLVPMIAIVVYHAFRVRRVASASREMPAFVALRLGRGGNGVVRE